MKNTTLNDIAARTGLSAKSVYGVLNNKPNIRVSAAKQELIRRAAREMNYTPNHFARALKEGRTMMVGVTTMRQQIGLFSDPYAAAVYAGVSNYYTETDYKLIFNNFIKTEADTPFLELARSRMVDGLIILLYSQDLGLFRENRIAEKLNDLRMPFVVVHSHSHDLGCHNVGLNSRAVGRRAAEHLKSHGFDAPALVSVNNDTPMLAEFRQGFADVVPDPVRLRIEGHHFDGGHRLAMELINRNELPRAMFTETDETAFGMMSAFRERGVSVPGQAAIVGYRNDNPSALALTGLTSISEPGVVKGQTAAEMLFTLMRGVKPDQRHVVLEPELRTRTSCGCT